jgi:hypothetical protein
LRDGITFQIFDRNRIPSCRTEGSVLQLGEKFYLNPMSRLGRVALTSPSLNTERISEYKLNYLPLQILDSNRIPSCTPVKNLEGDVSLTIPE